MSTSVTTLMSDWQSTVWIPTTSIPIDTFATDDIGMWFEWVGQDRHWDDGWELIRGLIVGFEMSPNFVNAAPPLEVINEYGEGCTREEALLDLLTSFTDYLEWLEEREDRLHPNAERELQALRGLVRRK